MIKGKTTPPGVKAAEIIAEIKGVPPEGYAAAFMLKTERDDPTLQVALKRKQSSTKGQGGSRPYEQVKTSVRAALNPAR